MASYEEVALVSLLVCVTIMGTCVCRLATCHKGVSLLVRIKYTALLVGSMAYGFQPLLFDTWPTPSSTFFAGMVLMGLFSSTSRWRSGPPAETVTRPSELWPE